MFLSVVFLSVCACALAVPTETGEILRPKLSYSRKLISKPGNDETIDCGVDGIDLSGVRDFNIQWSKMDEKDPINSFPISSGEQIVLFSNKYSVIHPVDSHQYSLKIKNIDEADSGTYRCTVNFGGSQRITADVPVMVEKAPFFNTQVTRVLTVNEGDSISIDCQPGGNPAPEIIWQRVEQKLPFYSGPSMKRNMMEIADITVDTEGLYVCHADNGIGTPARSEVIINVMYKPRVTVSESATAVDVKGVASVMCSVDAFPEAEVTWMKDGEVVRDSYNVKISRKRIPREVKNVPGVEKFAKKPAFVEETLRINEVTEEDIGVYHCVASNTLGAANQTFTLSTKTPPMIEKQSGRKVYYEDPTSYGREVEPVSLDCEASGVPTPSYSWVKNGSPLMIDGPRFSLDSDSGSLIIADPTPADNGNYQCVAHNDYGVAKSDIMQLLNATMVSFKEKTNDVHEEISAEEGRPLMVECREANGDPKPTITWLKTETDAEGVSQMSFVDSNRMTTGPDGKLYITHVTKEDDFSTSGIKFLCTAVGAASPNDYSIGLQVSVQVVEPKDNLTNADNPIRNISPFLMMGSQDQELKGAQDNKLHCIFGGEPAPFTAWERVDGKPLDEEHYELDNFNATLILKNTNLHHQGKYRCGGDNGNGETSVHEVSVTVDLPPVLRQDTMKPVSVAEGSAVTFNCDADASGVVTYLWYFNGHKVSEKAGSRRQQFGSKLSIASVAMTDIGNYACNATSTSGYAYGQSTLNVLPLTGATSPTTGGSYHSQQQFNTIKAQLDSIENSISYIVNHFNITIPSERHHENMTEHMNEEMTGTIGIKAETQNSTKNETPQKVYATTQKEAPQTVHLRN